MRLCPSSTCSFTGNFAKALQCSADSAAACLLWLGLSTQLTDVPQCYAVNAGRRSVNLASEASTSHQHVLSWVGLMEKKGQLADGASHTVRQASFKDAHHCPFSI